MKLWLALNIAEFAFSAIVTFGLLELILVKVPILFEVRGIPEVLLLMFLSSVVFVFHVATAFVYKSALGHRSIYAVFCVCVALHILFDSLSLFNLGAGVWCLSAALIYASVIAGGRLVALVNRRSNGI